MYIEQQIWNIPCKLFNGLNTWAEFFFLMRDARKT